MSNERDLVAWTRYPASYARRSSDLNCGLPKIAATTGKGVGLGGLRFPGGMTASFRRRPSSVRAGVLTARETAAQTDCFFVTFARNLMLGCTSNPVKSLCSNLDPM